MKIIPEHKPIKPRGRISIQHTCRREENVICYLKGVVHTALRSFPRSEHRPRAGGRRVSGRGLHPPALGEPSAGTGEGGWAVALRPPGSQASSQAGRVLPAPLPLEPPGIYVATPPAGQWLPFLFVSTPGCSRGSQVGGPGTRGTCPRRTPALADSGEAQEPVRRAWCVCGTPPQLSPRGGQPMPFPGGGWWRAMPHVCKYMGNTVVPAGMWHWGCGRWGHRVPGKAVSAVACTTLCPPLVPTSGRDGGSPPSDGT